MTCWAYIPLLRCHSHLKIKLYCALQRIYSIYFIEPNVSVLQLTYNQRESQDYYGVPCGDGHRGYIDGNRLCPRKDGTNSIVYGRLCHVFVCCIYKILVYWNAIKPNNMCSHSSLAGTELQLTLSIVPHWSKCSYHITLDRQKTNLYVSLFSQLASYNNSINCHACFHL